MKEKNQFNIKNHVKTGLENTSDFIKDKKSLGLEKVKEVGEMRKKVQVNLKKGIENTTNFVIEKNVLENISKVATKLGTTSVYILLIMFYTLQKQGVSQKSRSIILNSRNLFVHKKLDAVSSKNLMTDLLGILAIISSDVDDNVRQKAKVKMDSWFGKNVDVSKVDEIIESEDNIVEKI